MVQLLVRALSSLRFHEEGQAMVEYALIVALVSTAAFALITALGVYPSSVFSSINADF